MDVLKIVDQIAQCALPIAGGDAEGGVDFAAVEAGVGGAAGRSGVVGGGDGAQFGHAGQDALLGGAAEDFGGKAVPGGVGAT
jgi:hypothetical protein